MTTEKVAKKKKVKTEKVETKAETKAENNPLNNNPPKVAVVLVRGRVRVRKPIKYTLALLRLWKKNQCVVLKGSPAILGMLRKVKDFITWGGIDEETWQELLNKRGRDYKGRLTDSKCKYNYKVLEVQGKKYYPYFYLNPPRKGFGRKGIKVAFRAGGALGNRGEKINDLLKRML